jgi:hypothetical protein
MKRIVEKRRNEAVVCLHPSTQHIWPQLYACLSVVCPFCISRHPQLGQLGSVVTGARESLSRGYLWEMPHYVCSFFFLIHYNLRKGLPGEHFTESCRLSSVGGVHLPWPIQPCFRPQQLTPDQSWHELDGLLSQGYLSYRLSSWGDPLSFFSQLFEFWHSRDWVSHYLTLQLKGLWQCHCLGWLLILGLWRSQQ